MMYRLLKNADIIGTEEIIPGADLLIADDRIMEINRAGNIPKKRCNEVIDLKGKFYAAPGFIDIHVHGAAGREINEGIPEAWKEISQFKLSCGTTGYLATILTSSRERTAELCRKLAGFLAGNSPAANMLGVHCEGPFINPEQKGAQNEEYIRRPSLPEVKNWQEILGEYLKIVSLAPELEGALEIINYADEQDIITAAAHTGADYERMQQVYEAGLELGAHFFNGMKEFHHRNPGVIGAFLERKSRPVEIIADGVHLHPATVNMVIQNKGCENVIAVTDAMRGAGIEDGQYELGGVEISVQQGVARCQDGSLAGSTLTMNQALKNIIKFTGIDLPSACRLLSTNPAELLNLTDRGRLAAGKKADIVLLDEDLNVKTTIISGEIVYDER